MANYTEFSLLKCVNEPLSGDRKSDVNDEMRLYKNSALEQRDS